MTGAIYGSNLGGIAANFLVACFTGETPILTLLPLFTPSKRSWENAEVLSLTF